MSIVDALFAGAIGFFLAVVILVLLAVILLTLGQDEWTR